MPNDRSDNYDGVGNERLCNEMFRAYGVLGDKPEAYRVRALERALTAIYEGTAPRVGQGPYMTVQQINIAAFRALFPNLRDSSDDPRK